MLDQHEQNFDEILENVSEESSLNLEKFGISLEKFKETVLINFEFISVNFA